MPKHALFSLTVQTTAAVPANRLVGFGGTMTGAGAPVLGVAAFDAASGTDLAVDVIGVFDLEAGGAIARGALVASDASGLPVQTADTATAFGRALSAAAAPGDPVTVLIK